MDESLCSSENEIVQDALGKGKKKSKLRKKNKKARETEHSANLSLNEIKEDDDEIIDVKMDFKKKRRNALKEKSLAHQIFYKKEEDEENENEEEKNVEVKNLRLDPTDLSEFVLSEKEKEILEVDIPERIYLKYTDQR